ncbi:MAG: hypothetical protein A3I04_06985 [Nitrospinae bacterium RIFCSPLOWO2_02_FULL_39_110]|nr:MAG: hypothetical protein A3I04_06985 [Nitrospinae bacterium RIFCSPLOWO2_02_FULL_39_110]
MKQYIIPVFIPYSGCPHRCIFCNQKKIAGEVEGVNIETIRKTVDTWISLSAISHQPSAFKNRQVAFYGGSFTAIPLEKQEEILSSISHYLKNGVVDSIRLSTRPDSISAGNLALLKRYGVKTIELGVQSMDNRVLSLSERGHSSDDVGNTASLLKAHKFEVGIQIMPGLPGDTFESSINTADEVIKLKPDFVRIYPAVVIKDTGLADLYQKGAFKPLTLYDAIGVCKIMLMKFETNNIPVIRIGLQPTPSLIEKGTILDGPFHPALRQLVESEIAYDLMKYIIVNNIKRDRVSFLTSPTELSNFIGQKRVNIKRLESEFAVGMDIIADNELKPGGVIFDNSFEKVYIKRKDFLKKYTGYHNALTDN